jgi:CMP-N-acetylneuraminic acid synthetase
VLAKQNSKRLPRKNRLDFHGRPMFLVNVEKLLKVFDEVYVTSDSYKMLEQAEAVGAIGIWRDEKLCEDTPNIPIYQYCLDKMENVDGIVAVQACSPNINPKLFVVAKGLLEMGYDEVMTCHPMEHTKIYHDQANKIYGSLWAISSKKLRRYNNAYHPTPDALLVDTSEDIHYRNDYDVALKNYVH